MKALLRPSLLIILLVASSLLSIAPRLALAIERPDLVFFLVDRSGSIRNYNLQEPITRSIFQAIEELRDGTAVGIVFFNSSASELRRWPSIDDQARADIKTHFQRQFRPDGATRLYDTVGAVLDVARQEAPRHNRILIYIYSDGEDTFSKRYKSWASLGDSAKQLAHDSQESFIYWITIGFDPKESKMPPEVEIVQVSADEPNIPFPIPPPGAEIIAIPEATKTGEEVQFQHRSRGGPITSFAWDFGDGNSSSEPDPSHRYVAAGTYTIRLRVKGPNASSETVAENLVHIAEVTPLEARFSMYPERARVGEPVTFLDRSIGSPEQREWKVGSNPIGSDAELRWTPSTAGRISITLNITREAETDTTTQEIEVRPQAPSAKFTADPIQVPFQSEVRLKAVNTQDGWQHSWTVGGADHLEGTTAIWEARTAGPVEIIHRVEDSYGSVSTERDRIFVDEPIVPLPNAQFTATPRIVEMNSLLALRAIESEPDLTHKWVIDSDIELEGRETEWTVARTGNLTVSHQLFRDGEMINSADDEILAIEPDLAVARFKASRRSGRLPIEVKFTDQSEGRIVSYLWDFGDGNTSTEANPVHTYQEAGEYAVTLTVTNVRDRTSTNVEPTVIQVKEPLPWWVKWLAGAVGALSVWTLMIVPFLLTPLFGLAATKEKGRGYSLTSATGGKNYLHIAARKGSVLRYLWPKSTASVGTGKNCDIRLTVSQKSGPDHMASIKREPFAKRFRLVPTKGAVIAKVQPGAGGIETETPLNSPLSLKNEQVLSFSGSRYHWESPKKK